MTPMWDPSEGSQSDKSAPEFVCPNSEGWVLISESTGNVVPLRCRRLACTVCVLIQARRRSLAIAAARPQRALLLTQVGDGWDQRRDRLKHLRHAIVRETGAAFEWVWHVEPNPAGTGHHVHAWQHGDFVDQAVLDRLAHREGMGLTRINRVRSAAGAAHYGLKGLGYGLKSVQQGSAAAYLVANGRRLTHQSRGYFRSDDGGRLPVREAEEHALGATRDRDPGPWVLSSL